MPNCYRGFPIITWGLPRRDFRGQLADSVDPAWRGDVPWDRASYYADNKEGGTVSSANLFIKLRLQDVALGRNSYYSKMITGSSCFPPFLRVCGSGGGWGWGLARCLFIFFEIKAINLLYL